MKQSGIEWIGEIPDGWEICKTLYLLNMPITDGPHETPVLYDSGIPFISAEAVSCGNGHIDFSHMRGYISEEYYIECCKKYIPQLDDIYMIKSGATTGKIAKVETAKKFTIWSPLAVFRFNTRKVYIQFMYYYLQSECYQKQIEDKWTFGTQQNIGMRTLEKLKTVLPPIHEQEAIAKMLDSKCTQIDSIIEESKKSIEEYKAWKQSVIFEAVTGKNLNCKKKDSGIEWIGEIPEGWEVKRLKFASRNRIQKYTSDYGILNYFALENIESQSGRFIETENEYDISQSLICQKNDVVFGKLRPYLAKVYKVNELCCCSGEFAVFYDFEGCPSFFKYYFLSDGFIKIVDSSTYGTKMPRANIDFIKNMLVAIPPLPEQEFIAKMLDSKCAQIDSLITEKESLIADLTEYKKSLIFEVVTGKRSV